MNTFLDLIQSDQQIFSNLPSPPRSLHHSPQLQHTRMSTLNQFFSKSSVPSNTNSNCIDSLVHSPPIARANHCLIQILHLLIYPLQESIPNACVDHEDQDHVHMVYNTSLNFSKDVLSFHVSKKSSWNSGNKRNSRTIITNSDGLPKDGRDNS